MKITNNLKELRTDANFNQTEFARMCCVSRQTIHAVETSKYTPSIELALKIARILHLPVEEIFNLKEEK
jgi:putative transcriptional regulator